MATLREGSRKEWSGGDSINEINAGSLQRIADATEAMASSWVELRQRLVSLERMLADERACNERQSRTIAALRGVITRTKRSKGES